MKKITQFVLIVLCLTIACVSFGCLSVNSNIRMSVSTSLNNVSYEFESSNHYRALDKDFIARLNNAQVKLYELLSKNENSNYCVSPVSIYMALSLLDFIGDDKVKEEVGELLGLSQDDILLSNEVFEYLIRNVTSGDKTGVVNMTNSVWVDEEETPIEETLKDLAEKYYCYAYKTPFKTNNAKANKDIKNFVKKKTEGLIDQDFDLKSDTVFALINTLYFKDNWVHDGDALETRTDDFTTTTGKVSTEFLVGKYYTGKIASDELSDAFYTKTHHGFSIYFVMPKDGVSLKDVMTVEHISSVNKSINYSLNNDYHASTRVIFPSFELENDTKAKDIIKENGYLTHTFKSFKSTLLEDEVLVSEIKHSATLKVDKKGIKGAAVTVIGFAKSLDGEPREEFYDFLVNKEFGFYITVGDVIIFMGQVTNPSK